VRKGKSSSSESPVAGNIPIAGILVGMKSIWSGAEERMSAVELMEAMMSLQCLPHGIQGSRQSDRLKQCGSAGNVLVY
jgi:hypothetical protein